MHVTTSGPSVTVADGLEIDAKVDVVVEDHGGFDVRVSAEFAPESGRYETRQVTITRRNGGAEVTGEALRAVPVAGLLRTGIAKAVLPPGTDHTAPSDVAANGPTPETLSWVAKVYALAVLLGDAPTQRVAESLGVPRSTAARWVTRARDRGLLHVRDPRASKEG